MLIDWISNLYKWRFNYISSNLLQSISVWNMIIKACSLVCKVLIHRDASSLELFQLQATNQLKVSSRKVIFVKVKTKKPLIILRRKE